MLDVRSAMSRAVGFNRDRIAVVSGERELSYGLAWSRGLRMANALPRDVEIVVRDESYEQWLLAHPDTDPRVAIAPDDVTLIRHSAAPPDPRRASPVPPGRRSLTHGSAGRASVGSLTRFDHCRYST